MPHKPTIANGRGRRTSTRIHRRTAIMATLCVGMILGVARSATAQATSYQAVGVTTPSPIGYLSVLNDQNQPAVCRDADGTQSPDNIFAGDGNFVKKGATPSTLNKVQPDTSTFVTGICQTYIWGTHFPFLDVPRNIDFVKVSMGAGYQNTTPWSPGQSLDTRNPPQTGTPLGPITVASEGTYTFQFQTIAAATNCAIPTILQLRNEASTRWTAYRTGNLMQRATWPSFRLTRISRSSTHLL